MFSSSSSGQTLATSSATRRRQSRQIALSELESSSTGAMDPMQILNNLQAWLDYQMQVDFSDLSHLEQLAKALGIAREQTINLISRRRGVAEDPPCPPIGLLAEQVQPLRLPFRDADKDCDVVLARDSACVLCGCADITTVVFLEDCQHSICCQCLLTTLMPTDISDSSYLSRSTCPVQGSKCHLIQ